MIKRLWNRLWSRILRPSKRITELEWQVKYWRDQTRQANEQIEYWTQLAEYYKDQWDEALKHVPQHVKDDMLAPKECQH